MIIDRKWAVQVKDEGESWRLYAVAEWPNEADASAITSRIIAEGEHEEARIITIMTSVGDPRKELLDAMITRLAGAAPSYDEITESATYAAGGFDAAVQAATIVLRINWELGCEYVAERIQEINAEND